MSCLRANSSFAVSIPGQCPFERLLDPFVAEYSVTEGTEEAFRSSCRFLFKGVVGNKHWSNIGKQVYIYIYIYIYIWQDKEYS